MLAMVCCMLAIDASASTSCCHWSLTIISSTSSSSVEIIAGVCGVCESCGVVDVGGGESWRIGCILGCGTSHPPGGRVTEEKGYV